MRAVLCARGQRLEAVGDDGLVRQALAHRRQEHAMYVADEEYVRRVVEEHAYRLEHAAPYADVEGPDEGFGPEPY